MSTLGLGPGKMVEKHDPEGFSACRMAGGGTSSGWWAPAVGVVPWRPSEQRGVGPHFLKRQQALGVSTFSVLRYVWGTITRMIYLPRDTSEPLMPQHTAQL